MLLYNIIILYNNILIEFLAVSNCDRVCFMINLVIFIVILFFEFYFIINFIFFKRSLECVEVPNKG